MNISPVVFDFLSLLEQNNQREWFAKNRHLYEESLSIITSFADELIKKIAEFDNSIALESSKTSIFRIYRDIRFSPNKLPYKHFFGIYIAKGGKSSKYAGYYLHIQNNKSEIAGGLWCPEKEVLSKIREDIYYNPEEILSILNQKSIKKEFTETGSEYKLKNPPRGYSSDFEHIDLLKNKHFMLGKYFTNAEVLNKNFMNRLVELYCFLYPYNKYLNSVIEYENE
ncbi:MAG TPA: DUF2461 domain-containing protein [Bacteroidales bacterium]|nr:DUF2461 domain-containing protein [Bacteroidales bacterium]HOR81240.1 DUF2461 domain-containing protein [Bacteroidales bacterium]HPJ90507.1 DUF2461 domain-containing protein [Bacteroidales bacterium]